ncbi:MAG TPA: DUF4349 domain-containing protein [Mucilaginibacter sp.]|nr:DUF4349 domain-containing protein [Mucilaginibacter sp.]
MKNLILTATLLLIFSSCGNKNSNSDSVKFPPPVVMADEEVMEENPPTIKELQIADPGVKSIKGDPNADIRIDEPVGNSDAKEYVVLKDPATGKLTVDTSKKIIKDGDISFETNNINATRKKILYSLKKLGGYVVEDNQSTDNESHRKDYTLKLRVPAKYFDLLLDTVSAAADKIDSKNISITDITTKYIDITTRLGNKKLLESRYQDLLKKATKISDLLEIENKLTEIRSDIESTQGQLNYLNKQVAYSSLSLTFYTRLIVQADKPVGFGYKFKYALSKGWSFMQTLFYKIIALWPLWLLVVVLSLVFKARRNKKRLARENV